MPPSGGSEAARQIERSWLGLRLVLRLPDPMLARTGEIPTASGWVFEPKLDGAVWSSELCTWP